MPSVKRPGMVGVYVELPEKLRDDAKRFAASRGEQFADVVRLAIERHMAYPPPPPVPVSPPPLTPLPDAAPAASATRKAPAEPKAEAARPAQSRRAKKDAPPGP